MIKNERPFLFLVCFILWIIAMVIIFVVVL